MSQSNHPADEGLEFRSSVRGARVVITGASGFIGRHLCRVLATHGAKTFAFQRYPNAGAEHAHQVIPVELGERDDVVRALRAVQPDIVFHLAGFVSGDRSAHAIAHAFDGNVLPSANLLLGCAEHQPNARVIVTTSLDASNPWRSSAQTGSPYGVSKLMVELLAGGMRRLAGCNVVAARIGMAYGPSDPNHHRLVPSVVTSLLRGESPLVGTGSRRCDFIHVDDVAQGLTALAAAPELSECALDLGCGELVSIREVAELIHRLLPGAVPLAFDESLDRPNEQERAADVETTSAAIGFRAQIPLPAGLERTIAWYRTQLMAAGAARQAVNRPS